MRLPIIDWLLAARKRRRMLAQIMACFDADARAGLVDPAFRPEYKAGVERSLKLMIL